ncbi:TrkH family potassium uptake protein [Agathobaculum sp.]|uniref:TrkH family potassium uptake protein n=1 Tax=Agathobaculum sp. TaxID=2048138 RepID=UPI002A7FF9C9|nr:TrkH family potassium uptake protein [Agathobaculum sp.]MDY3617404.1 TrkH family potassium uptake protein [Agathobaculum sp.]
MNISMVRYLLGWMLGIESAFLLLPMAVALARGEREGLAFLFTAALCLLCGVLMARKKPVNNRFYAREGFVTVALCWIVLALTGALPFVLSGEIPSYVDALFETISGFTTTGATILSNVEALSHASLLWRSLTHWVGGMGVLVFMLAVLPLAGGHSMYLMRAESPGPSVSKLSPHLRTTAMILYGIYFGLTVLETVLLLLGGMPLFDAVNAAMATAGTGGFGIWNDSMAHYNSYYLQGVISVFMILFGVNFSLYFLILTRRWKQALKSEELRLYLGVIAAATVVIGLNVWHRFGSLFESLHHALFQVSSIITTTGFATADFDQWPALSKCILVLLMFIGACAGSTGGGIKCSRIMLMFKSVRKEMQFLIHPRSVRVNQLDGHRVQHEVVRSVNVFLIAYMLIFILSVLLLSIESPDLVTNFTAVAATLNNVGPGLELVGPTCNFGFFSPFSKAVLMFDMLAGRLELFPMLLLFSPATWRRNR